MPSKKYPKTEGNSCVNGQMIPATSDLLNNVPWEKLADGLPCFIHGDLQPDNIIYDSAKKKFTLIDWRQEFAGQIDFGDLYYDLAKLSGGINLNYAQIKMNKFTYSESEDSCDFSFPIHPNAQEINLQLENYITGKGYSLTKVKLLVGLIYLNMSPLHQEPFDKMLHALGRQIIYELEMQKSDV